jgi:hypothetical protein
MKRTNVYTELARIGFAQTAARQFAHDPKLASYGDVNAPGGFIALRWGLMDDGVLVLTLSDEHESVNYAGLIPRADPQDREQWTAEERARGVARNPNWKPNMIRDTL